MNYSFFTTEELTLLIIWVIAMTAVTSWIWRRRDKLMVFSPLILLIVVNFYYCLQGPVWAVLKNETVYRGIDARDDLILAWFASLVSFLVIVLVYFYSRPRPRPPQLDRQPFTSRDAWKLGQQLNGLGLLLYLGVVGTSILDLLNPFGLGHGTQAVYTGAFQNYLSYGVNFLIPGISLMWIGWLQQRRNPTALMAWLLVAVGVYTSLGFRYRLAILAGILYLLFYLVLQQRPKILVTAAFFVLLIVASGYIVSTRSYGRGLDLTSAEGLSFGDFFDAGLSEANIFFTSAGILRITPEIHPYVGFQPIVSTLLFPVPRGIWEDKDTFSYMADALETLYGSENRALGAAFMGWTEWYLMAGWFGVILGSAIYGWLYRWLWEWFSPRRQDPIACTFYAAAVCYQYVIISRGYMPQQAMLFCFTVLPVWVLYRWLNRRPSRRIAPQSSQFR